MNKLLNLGRVKRETKGTVPNGLLNDGGSKSGYLVVKGDPCSTTHSQGDVYNKGFDTWSASEYKKC